MVKKLFFSLAVLECSVLYLECGVLFLDAVCKLCCVPGDYRGRAVATRRTLVQYEGTLVPMTFCAILMTLSGMFP